MIDSQVEIRDEPNEGAYVIEVDGRRAGKAVYRMRRGRKVFLHTEIDDEFTGSGLGARLVEYAMDDVRQKSEMMVPMCPFFAAYLERHPENEDIVDRELTNEMNSRRRQG